LIDSKKAHDAPFLFLIASSLGRLKPHLNAQVSQILFGFWNRMLTEVKNARRQHRICATLQDAIG
jgi:hypothetical protein